MPTDAQTLCNTIATEGYDKLSKRALLEAILAALASGGGGGSCSAQSGAGSPVGSATPAFIGQLYHDTVADAYWRSTGLTVGDWVAIGGGSVWDFMAEAGPLDFSIANSLISGPLVFQATATYLNGFRFGQLQNVTSIAFPNMVSMDNYFEVSQCNNCVSVLFPLLVNNGDWISIADSIGLTTISIPNWVPTDGFSYNFQGNALSAPSVESLLRRFVLASVTTCNLTMQGGTNAGLASLSAQGQADAATLGAQLTINP